MLSKEQLVFSFFEEEKNDLIYAAYKFASRIHSNHSRQDGLPYIVHPLEMSYFALIRNIRDPLVHALIFCHDTVEESRDVESVTVTEKQIAAAVGKTTARETIIMTKRKGADFQELVKHINIIEQHVRCALVKMLDRYSNLRRSMFGHFNEKRMQRYVLETYQILAMSERVIAKAELDHDFKDKNLYAEYNNAFREIRAAIKGILRGAEFALRNFHWQRKYQEAQDEISALKSELEKRRKK